MDYGGVGTSFVADIYLSFSVVGVVLLPFLHGLITGKLVNEAFTVRSTVLIVIFAAFASLAIFAGRAAYFGFVKSCVWVAVSYIVLLAIYQVLLVNQCRQRRLDAI
jgi:amino acid permease